MLEVRTPSGWVPLSVTPPVPESRLHFRGAQPGEVVSVGGVDLTADASGVVNVSLFGVDGLSGHIGLAVVCRDGAVVGEVEVVPEKMSQPAFEALQADLRTVWGDLVLSRSGSTAVRAGLPPASELLGRIEVSLKAVFDEPRDQIGTEVVARRLHQCRSPRELTANMVRRGSMGLLTAVPTAVRVNAPGEVTLVAETLDRLGRLAVRQGDVDTARRLSMLSRHPSLEGRGDRVRTIPWGARTDPRYRRIHAVWRLLNRPELEPVVGPGELRLGVKALPRLFEYWVFLQVARQVESIFGAPLDDGYASLARPMGASGLFLDIAAGTTLRFPGDVMVAFEPAVHSSGLGWEGVEYVPHPNPRRPQIFTATPDVVVAQFGSSPRMVVLDAKYVGRRLVDATAADLHEKYARMRLRGVPVVREVLAVHPHADKSMRWAGYGYVGATPGAEFPELGFEDVLEVPRRVPPPEPAPVRRNDRAFSEGLPHQWVRFCREWRKGSDYWSASDWRQVLRSLLMELFSPAGRFVVDDAGRVSFADLSQVLRSVSVEREDLGGRPASLLDFVRQALADEPTLVEFAIGRYASTGLPFLARRSSPVAVGAEGLGLVPNEAGPDVEPFGVVYDQWWVETTHPNLRLDMGEIRRYWVGAGAGIFYVVGSAEGNRFSFQRAAAGKQWDIWPAPTRIEQVRGAGLLAGSFIRWFPTGTIVCIGNDPEFIAALGSHGHDVRGLTKLDRYRLGV